jgi:hypothetical protein
MKEQNQINYYPYIQVKSLQFNLILITPIVILITHHLAVFAHEYAHSIIAWSLGYKHNPLEINYGGTSMVNILFLLNIDQAVDNELIYSLGHHRHVGLIAAAGIGANFLFYSLSFFALKKIKNSPYFFYFILFFNLMNLGNIFDYLPIRIFATRGNMVDIVDIEKSFNLSPWLIYCISSYIVTFLIWQFFTKTLNLPYVILEIASGRRSLKAALMIVCVIILFGYFALPGFFDIGEIPYFLSITSLSSIPGIIFILWPKHK